LCSGEITVDSINAIIPGLVENLRVVEVGDNGDVDGCVEVVVDNVAAVVFKY
jgi:hypothetical protein